MYDFTKNVFAVVGVVTVALVVVSKFFVEESPSDEAEETPEVEPAKE